GGGYAVAANETTDEGAVQARRAMWRAAYRDEADSGGSMQALIEAAGSCLALEPEAAKAVDDLLEGAYSHRKDFTAAQRAAADAAAVEDFLAGALDVHDLLFGGEGEAAQAVSPRASGAPIGQRLGFPTLADYLADPAPADELMARVEEAFAAAGDTRMHNEPLAAALGMSVSEMQTALRERGVRPLKRAFERNGK